jgi:hypothetical protein
MAESAWNRRLPKLMTETSTAHELAEIVISALPKGTVVEIDGLGVFVRTQPKGAASSLAGRRCSSVMWRGIADRPNGVVTPSKTEGSAPEWIFENSCLG